MEEMMGERGYVVQTAIFLKWARISIIVCAPDEIDPARITSRNIHCR